jgi:hypothetical protein
MTAYPFFVERERRADLRCRASQEFQRPFSARIRRERESQAPRAGHISPEISTREPCFEVRGPRIANESRARALLNQSTARFSA